MAVGKEYGECQVLVWGAKLMNLKAVEAQLMDQAVEINEKLMPMVNMMAKVFTKFEPLVTDELLDKIVEKMQAAMAKAKVVSTEDAENDRDPCTDDWEQQQRDKADEEY